MKDKKTIVLILVLLISCGILFMFYDTGENLDYVLSRRGIRLATMLVVGVSVAY